MDLKDKSDAELNEMIAETTGIVPQHDMSIMSEYSGATCSKCHKAQVYILRDKSPCLPLDYCNSAEAQAKLEKYLQDKGVDYGTGWQGGAAFASVDGKQPIWAAITGRALCGAFVTTVGKKNK